MYDHFYSFDQNLNCKLLYELTYGVDFYRVDRFLTFMLYLKLALQLIFEVLNIFYLQFYPIIF